MDVIKNTEYHVITFTQLPYESIDTFVCVPHSWLAISNDRRVGVAYPIEKPLKTERRVRRKELPENYWRIYQAVVKYDTDSYDEAEKWIASRDDDDEPSLEICSDVDTRDEDEESNMERRASDSNPASKPLMTVAPLKTNEPQKRPSDSEIHNKRKFLKSTTTADKSFEYAEDKFTGNMYKTYISMQTAYANQGEKVTHEVGRLGHAQVESQDAKKTIRHEIHEHDKRLLIHDTRKYPEPKINVERQTFTKKNDLPKLAKLNSFWSFERAYGVPFNINKNSSNQPATVGNHRESQIQSIAKISPSKSKPPIGELKNYETPKPSIPFENPINSMKGTQNSKDKQVTEAPNWKLERLPDGMPKITIHNPLDNNNTYLETDRPSVLQSQNTNGTFMRPDNKFSPVPQPYRQVNVLQDPRNQPISQNIPITNLGPQSYPEVKTTLNKPNSPNFESQYSSPHRIPLTHDYFVQNPRSNILLEKYGASLDPRIRSQGPKTAEPPRPEKPRIDHFQDPRIRERLLRKTQFEHQNRKNRAPTVVPILPKPTPKPNQKQFSDSNKPIYYQPYAQLSNVPDLQSIPNLARLPMANNQLYGPILTVNTSYVDPDPRRDLQYDRGFPNEIEQRSLYNGIPINPIEHSYNFPNQLYNASKRLQDQPRHDYYRDKQEIQAKCNENFDKDSRKFSPNLQTYSPESEKILYERLTPNRTDPETKIKRNRLNSFQVSPIVLDDYNPLSDEPNSIEPNKSEDISCNNKPAQNKANLINEQFDNLRKETEVKDQIKSVERCDSPEREVKLPAVSKSLNESFSVESSMEKLFSPDEIRGTESPASNSGTQDDEQKIEKTQKIQTKEEKKFFNEFNDLLLKLDSNFSDTHSMFDHIKQVYIKTEETFKEVLGCVRGYCEVANGIPSTFIDK